MARTWTGGCQCGQIRYEFDPAEILTLYCCHCQECQRQASSAFGMSLWLPRQAFRLTHGSLAQWQRGTDRGNVNTGNFCPNCGVRIFHGGNSEDSIVSLKAGSLDDTSSLRPVGHIWTKRAQPWVVFAADALVDQGDPDDMEPFVTAYRVRKDSD